MNVILTSEFHRVADKLLTQGYLDQNKKKVAFIQNATDIRQDAGEIIHRVEAPKTRYKDHGYELDIIDLRVIKGDILIEKLATYDYLHIHGGDNEHLHAICKQSGLTQHINRLLNNGLIYIGSSAGSLLAGPDTTYAIVTSTTFKSEISKEELESIDFTGLQLHPFYFIPHFGKPDRFQMNRDRLQYCAEHKLSPFITCADDQAIIIEDEKFEFIS